MFMYINMSHVHYLELLLYTQIQAVTSVGAGNFSSPVIVELDGSSKPRSSSAVGLTVAVIIIILSIVVAFLIVCMYITW